MTTKSLTDTPLPTFKFWSIAHYKILTAAAQARNCTCEPYRDWFTYNTWKSLGYQVQKGEGKRSVKLTTWIPCEKTQADGTKKESLRPKGYTVFCACQVKPIEKD